MVRNEGATQPLLGAAAFQNFLTFRESATRMIRVDRAARCPHGCGKMARGDLQAFRLTDCIPAPRPAREPVRSSSGRRRFLDHSPRRHFLTSFVSLAHAASKRRLGHLSRQRVTQPRSDQSWGGSYSHAMTVRLYGSAALIAALAAARGYRSHSLSRSGAAAAALLGYSALANPLSVFGVCLLGFYLAGSRATKVRL